MHFPRPTALRAVPVAAVYASNKKMKAPLVWRRDVLRDRFREGFRRRDVLRHPNQPATIVDCAPGRPHRLGGMCHPYRADSGEVTYAAASSRSFFGRVYLYTIELPCQEGGEKIRSGEWKGEEAPLGASRDFATV